MVANLNVLDEFSLGNNDAGTLVSTYEWKFGWEWPVAIDGVQVGVADTRELDVDQDLVWTGLLHWNLLVLDWSSSLFNDLSPLLLGNVLRHVVWM